MNEFFLEIGKAIKNLVAPYYYFLKRNLFRIVLLCGSKDIRCYRNILIIAPHPDDEIFGLGGYILRCLDQESAVHVLFLTCGEASHSNLDGEIIAAQRKSISNRVLEKAGIPLQHVFRWTFPDGTMPFEHSSEFRDAVTRLSSFLQSLEPDAVFVTDSLDMWPGDHVSACAIARKALSDAAVCCDLYGFFVWMWYLLPIKKMISLSKVETFKMNIEKYKQSKKFLIQEYLRDIAPNGKPWSGELPPAFLKAFNFSYEFFRKIPLLLVVGFFSYSYHFY